MKLEKATKILTHMSKSANVSSLEDCITAIKLGIEALKDHQKARKANWYPPGYKLPGETEE